ncbi:glycosyltransferase [Fervidobacterium sp.]
MKVLVIGYMHQKDDKRVFRTVKALSTKAEVIYQYFSKDETEPYKDGNILYYPLKKETRKGILKKMMSRYKFDSSIVKLIEKEEYDILYLHGFPFTKPLAGFKIAKKRGKKIIYDLHELHPEDFFENWILPFKVLKRKILWNILRGQIKMSDKLVLVSHEVGEQISRKLGIKKDVMVLPNYASFSLISSSKAKEICIVGKTKKMFANNEIEIIKELSNRGFRIKVIGFVADELNNLNVVQIEALPYSEMMNEISKSAFSWLSFYTSTENLSKNDIFMFPHKFFDSIAASTPVIVRREFVQMRKIVEELNIGVVIDIKDIQGSVKKIIDSYENYDLIMKNIRKYQNEFIWSKEKEEKFLDFVLK